MEQSRAAGHWSSEISCATAQRRIPVTQLDRKAFTSPPTDACGFLVGGMVEVKVG